MVRRVQTSHKQPSRQDHRPAQAHTTKKHAHPLDVKLPTLTEYFAESGTCALLRLVDLEDEPTPRTAHVAHADTTQASWARLHPKTQGLLSQQHGTAHTHGTTASRMKRLLGSAEMSTEWEVLEARRCLISWTQQSDQTRRQRREG